MISKIKQHSQNLEEDNGKTTDALDNFEKKVNDMKISEQDHFFLNKEMLRHRNTLNAMES